MKTKITSCKARPYAGFIKVNGLIEGRPFTVSFSNGFWPSNPFKASSVKITSKRLYKPLEQFINGKAAKRRISRALAASRNGVHAQFRVDGGFDKVIFTYIG